jgi:hypothetical protein
MRMILKFFAKRKLLVKAGPAKRLAEFIESFSQKLRNYSSLKTLDDLKEMLHKNRVNWEDINSIKQFTPSERLINFQN